MFYSCFLSWLRFYHLNLMIEWLFDVWSLGRNSSLIPSNDLEFIPPFPLTHISWLTSVCPGKSSICSSETEVPRTNGICPSCNRVGGAGHRVVAVRYQLMERQRKISGQQLHVEWLSFQVEGILFNSTWTFLLIFHLVKWSISIENISYEIIL